MKKKIAEIDKIQVPETKGKLISRKDAIKKTGYIAVSAATMMILLNTPTHAQTSQPAPPPSTPNKPSGGGPWKKK